jgi:hypothetical protein
MKKRIIYSTLFGAILGLFCIIGASQRLGFTGNEPFIIALWYNRIILGFVVGLSGKIMIVKGKRNPIIRGVILGAVIGGEFFLASGMKDIDGFYAALVYGLLIDFVVTAFIDNKNKYSVKK